MWERVHSYSLLWSATDNVGATRLYFEDGSHESIAVSSPAALAGFATILRGDDDCYFDRDHKHFTTGTEPPG